MAKYAVFSGLVYVVEAEGPKQAEAVADDYNAALVKKQDEISNKMTLSGWVVFVTNTLPQTMGLYDPASVPFIPSYTRALDQLQEDGEESLPIPFLQG